MESELKFSELTGKTITAIEIIDCERVIFTTKDGQFTLYHMQDCCESVNLVDVVGNLPDIINLPIVEAIEEVHDKEMPDLPLPHATPSDSYTWTIHAIHTGTGRVRFVWLGESNGYYSESVYFGRI